MVEASSMGEEYDSYEQRKSKKRMKKAKKEKVDFNRDNPHKSGRGTGKEESLKDRKIAQASRIRKQVDPETAKYFSEIANLFESNEVDLEERSVICGNALEETRGKEFELATDYIISHTLQSLLEACDVDNLCSFLQSCTKDFPFIAMDRSGSHVAETAIKSLAAHLEHHEGHPLIEEALTVICKVVAANSVDVMCNCYGSHVLRSLLCLCKGVPLDKCGYYVSKSATNVADRLNLKTFPSKEDDPAQFQPGFPELLKFLVSEILVHVKEFSKTLLVDQFSSLVLQTALKLLAGNDEELFHVIPVLIGCEEENIAEGNLIETARVRELVKLLKEPASSRLMEVVLEVSPEALYNVMFAKVFRNSLFELSSHECGNFVIQALISRVRNQDQMEVIWEELGPNIESLFKMGRSGVVAALIAASERLHIHEHKSCQVLAETVCSVDGSTKWIIPRLLFLDHYFTCEDKSNWSWHSGAKMHVIGSLILQTVFRFRSEYIKPYIASITTMEDHHVLEAAKDSGGSRVIEAFLSSGAPGKQKRRLINKLRGHFGEIALHPSGSFTVETCFTTSNLSLREAIVSELLSVRSELSKTKQGSYILRKLDVDGFAARPDHWRSKQTSKESTYKDFYATFASDDNKSTKMSGFLADTSNKNSKPKTVKEVSKEIGQ
ncbi:pumilio homolog 23-like, partial [Neltuma alba]